MTYLPRNIFVAVLLAASALALALAAPAVAKTSTPCWKTLINDWYDGRIDGTYAIHCYRDALKHLPADVDTYSSARDDIKQALQDRITQSHSDASKSGGTTTTTGGGGTSGSGGGSSGPSGSGGGSGGSKSGGSSGGGSAGGDKSAAGPIGQAFSVGKPSKADSVPVPLIVLGGVALLLMAAGAAGFMTRRLRTRRLQLASAATLPHREGSGRPEQS